MSEVVRVELPSGDEVWARVDVDDDGPVDVGFADTLATVYQLHGFVETLGGVAETVRMGLAANPPDTVAVQFGIEVSGKTGKVVSVLAQAGAKATINVTLTWNNRHNGPPQVNPGSPDDEDQDPQPTEAGQNAS